MENVGRRIRIEIYVKVTLRTKDEVDALSALSGIASESIDSRLQALNTYNSPMIRVVDTLSGQIL